MEKLPGDYVSLKLKTFTYYSRYRSSELLIDINTEKVTLIVIDLPFCFYSIYIRS
jgi:hypothetical protein